MRLVSVEISNYRVIRHTAINFPDALIGIVGPNGAGKSSLVEAISWALYGQQAARSGRSEVKSAFAAPSESCEVKLSFEVRGAEHRVIRRLVGAGERLEVELYRGGNLEVVGSTETQQYIERMLGLDWRGYITSVFARQSDLDAFSGLQPAKRREHLVGMLGIDRLDRAMERAKGDMRIDAERAVLLEKQSAGLGELETGLGRIREQLTAAEKKLVVADGARDEADRKLNQIKVQFAEHESANARCSLLDSQLELARAERRQLTDQSNRLGAEKRGLEAVSKQSGQDREKLAELDSVRAEFKRLEKVKESAAAIERNRKERESIAGRLKLAESTYRQSAAKVIEIQKSIEQMPTPTAQVVNEAKEKLEAERERYHQLTEQKKQAEREVQKTKDSLAQIASLGGEAVCSRCLRPYGADIEQIRIHLGDELKQLAGTLEQLAEQLRTSTRNGAAAKDRVNKLEEAIERNRVLRQSSELAQSEQQQVESQRTMLTEQLESLNRQLKEAGDFEFDQARFTALAKRLSELESIQRKVMAAEGELKRLPVVERSLQELSQRVESVDRKIAELNGERAGVRFDKGAFERSRTDLQQAELAARSAHDDQMKAAHLKELLTKETQSTEARLRELQAVMADLKVVRERRNRTDRLSKIFGELRRNLVAGIRPRLAEFGSQLLDEMTSGRYNLMELDEDYNISIFDDGQAYGIDRFSGGESDLANLCLRLAVSLALAESAGLERSLIILDEVFGSQDESRRERIYQGLAGLKPSFPQIIAITHIEELKNRVETIIEVEPTGKGWSEVRVDGVGA